MGSFIGHVLPGVGFLLMGLWHLFNTIQNYAQSPWEFRTRAWFPTKFRGKILRHLELLAIIMGSSLQISMELFIGPKRHQPLEDDWSIPPQHLHNFEHSSIALLYLIYACVALHVDARGLHVPEGMLHLIATLAFGQEAFLFHFHSADHVGLEGYYHWILQLIVLVSFFSTLLEIPFPQSVLVAMVRSASILFQGIWFIHMAFMLWIPAFIPKGCEPQPPGSHSAVKCGDEKAIMRANALANLQLSWYLAAVVLFTIVMYFKVFGRYSEKVAYKPVNSKSGNMVNKEVEMGGDHHSRDGSQSSIDLVIPEDALVLE